MLAASLAAGYAKYVEAFGAAAVSFWNYKLELLRTRCPDC